MIKKNYSNKLKKDYPLDKLTTFRIGGKAQYFYIADTLKEILEIIKWAKVRNIPYFILGNGSNILISDKGFPGIVIKLGKDFCNILINITKNEIIAGGGLNLTRLGMFLVNKGCSGFEYMCVIPGTVGAAVRINAGTSNEGEIKDNFISAKILTDNMEILNFSREEMNFSYRYSQLVDISGIVLEASFYFSPDKDPTDLKKKAKRLLLKRRKKQPRIKRNCGSVFRKPKIGKTAGWYIEQAGLKGFRVGDAQVDTEHANWIVNLKKAKAEDVKKIIHTIQEEVFKRFGVKLEREVIYVPEDIIKP